MNEDDTYRKLMRSDINTVDQFVIENFNFTSVVPNTASNDVMISDLTDNDMLLLKILLAQHYWDIEDYFRHSKILWDNTGFGRPN